MGAIQFIENMDRTTLTITDDEFEKNVEAAVSSIAEKHRIESPRMAQEPVFNEKGHPPAGPSGSRTSYDGQDGPAGRGSTSMDDPNSESAAIAGILKTFQKPLSSIGRMFTDEGSQHGGHPPQSSTGPSLPPRSPTLPPPDHSDLQRPSSRHTLSAEEAAARQASAEAAEAQRLHRAEHTNIVETLAGMFPDLDRDIISDVVYQKEGRYVSTPPADVNEAMLTCPLGSAWPLMPALLCLRELRSKDLTVWGVGATLFLPMISSR